MKRAIVGEAGGEGNDPGSINAPVVDSHDEKTASEAVGGQVHRHEPGDVNHPSSLGGTPISGGVANCGVCGH